MSRSEAATFSVARLIATGPAFPGGAAADRPPSAPARRPNFAHSRRNHWSCPEPSPYGRAVDVSADEGKA